MTGEVLDVYGEVMPGLYACGEASNGAIYDLSLIHISNWAGVP